MQKQEKIVQMFNEIAPSYDKANRILSFGIDITWRKRACNYVLKNYDKTDLNIIDVACGTADMINIWQQEALKLDKKISKIIGIDPSEGMLEIAKEKYKKVTFIKAFAQDLPLENESADIMSISYGLRNVVERKKALKEFFRVLKKDGLLLILEFSKQEKKGFLSFFRDFYLKNILPILGGFLSKNKSAYEYLPNSIDHFLSEQELAKELQEIGFKIVKINNFSFGISSMFVAKK